jgi:hypothetical protein
LWLDREVREQRYPSVADLREEFGIGRRTALATVAFLRGSLRAPLHYSREKRGYVYEDPTYALPAVFLQEGELLALKLLNQSIRLGPLVRLVFTSTVGPAKVKSIPPSGPPEAVGLGTPKRSCSTVWPTRPTNCWSGVPSPTPRLPKLVSVTKRRAY